jgi:hypothetical protein
VSVHLTDIIEPWRACATGFQACLKSPFSAFDMLIQYHVSPFKSPYIYLSPPARSIRRLKEHDLGLLISTDQMKKLDKSCCMLQSILTKTYPSATPTNPQPIPLVSPHQETNGCRPAPPPARLYRTSPNRAKQKHHL